MRGRPNSHVTRGHLRPSEEIFSVNAEDSESASLFACRKTRRKGMCPNRKTYDYDFCNALDADLDGATSSYETCRRAYVDALTELRVPFIVKQQWIMGAIGGFDSHEFHVPAVCGEDSCPDPVTGEPIPSLEIVHIFLLGDKYTTQIGATYVGADGARRSIQMCSFGMGTERTVSAFFEAQLARSEEPAWSWR